MTPNLLPLFHGGLEAVVLAHEQGSLGAHVGDLLIVGPVDAGGLGGGGVGGGHTPRLLTGQGTDDNVSPCSNRSPLCPILTLITTIVVTL